MTKIFLEIKTKNEKFYFRANGLFLFGTFNVESSNKDVETIQHDGLFNYIKKTIWSKR